MVALGAELQVTEHWADLPSPKEQAAGGPRPGVLLNTPTTVTQPEMSTVPRLRSLSRDHFLCFPNLRVSFTLHMGLVSPRIRFFFSHSSQHLAFLWLERLWIGLLSPHSNALLRNPRFSLCWSTALRVAPTADRWTRRHGRHTSHFCRPLPSHRGNGGDRAPSSGWLHLREMVLLRVLHVVSAQYIPSLPRKLIRRPYAKSEGSNKLFTQSSF